jgi:hypothetical protein
LLHNGGVVLSTKAQGAILGSVSLLGILFLIFRGPRGGRLIALTTLSFIYISDIWVRSYAEARHLNIIFPFLCLGAAALVYWVMDMLFTRGRGLLKSPLNALAVILPVLIVLPSAYRIVGYNRLITREDSRTAAKEWIEMNIPPGTKILVDHYCVPLKMSPQRAKDFQRKAEAEAGKGPFTAHAIQYYRYYSQTVKEPTYELQEISHPWWKDIEEIPGTYMLSSEFDRDFGNPLKEWGVLPLGEYKSQGYQYLVTIEFLMSMYLDNPRGKSFPSFVRFYREVEGTAVLVRQFEPNTLQGPGPKVFIYKL